MDVFSFVTLFGGLAFFLYGMRLLSESLKKTAGGRLEKQGTREEILPGLLRDTCSVLESKMRRDGE